MWKTLTEGHIKILFVIIFFGRRVEPVNPPLKYVCQHVTDRQTCRRYTEFPDFPRIYQICFKTVNICGYDIIW